MLPQSALRFRCLLDRVQEPASPCRGKRPVALISDDAFSVVDAHHRNTDRVAATEPELRYLVAEAGHHPVYPLRANIDETVLLVVITEQGENRNQCEEQRNLFGFSHGLARRGT